VFYYLRVTVAMYMEEPQGESVPVSWAIPGAVAVAVSVILTLWFGIAAQGLLEQAQRSIRGLL
jgi:NADH-quinone oxidoreductase subunit N